MVIVRTSEKDTLYRYIGTRKGIPDGFQSNLYPDQEFLVFDTGIPIYGVGCELPYKFLAVNGQKIQASNLLDTQVDELEVIGNIEDRLWDHLAIFTKWHLDSIKLKQGNYNVLVSTNVGEEGLDIAECDLVVFYDVVASEIRLIQRKGRTARHREGKVIILYCKGTHDEIYLRIAFNKLKKMNVNLKGSHQKLDSESVSIKDNDKKTNSCY